MADDLFGRLIILKRRVPSQNATQYRHWSYYHAEKEAWFVLLRAQLVPRIAEREPVRIILRSLRTRLVDYANLVGGAKPIPDALKRLGYIHDDSPRWFHCDYYQSQVPKDQERTELQFVPWGMGEDQLIDGDDGSAVDPR
jgi:hypothetical protein